MHYDHFNFSKNNYAQIFLSVFHLIFLLET